MTRFVPRSPALVLMLASCATTSAQLARDAASCESFATFDEQTRRQLDALLTEAPGDTLVREASRLNTARRTCARHVLEGLLALREARGVEAVQQELDALSATYRRDDLRALMTQTLGEDVANLEPLLLEARLRVNRSGAAAGAERLDDVELNKLKVDAPETTSPPPEVPESMCDERSPCAQLRCVVEHPPSSPEAAARACLDEATALEPQVRAKRAAEVLSLLPPAASPARTEARMMLDTLRLQLWPQVEAAIAAKQPGRAAQVASLFRALPAVSERVEQLRDAAQAHHLARARELAASPEAAWLHRRLAEELGGPEAPPLAGTGKWEAPRWRCKTPMPTPLPALPPGVGATLTMRCVEAPPEKKKSGDDSMRTFELESSLQGQRLDGTLHVTCADRSSSYTVRVEDPGVEGFPEEALRQELQRLAARTLPDCARIHEFAATRSCTELRKRTPGEIITRFVDHARFLGRWEPCFEEWLLATEGVTPPAPFALNAPHPAPLPASQGEGE
ncbi:MAG: hypothetical protein Q8L48_13710 [Archangium sp.]|nr:hypothetical protein [Archangium sp.]